MGFWRATPSRVVELKMMTARQPAGEKSPSWARVEGRRSVWATRLRLLRPVSAYHFLCSPHPAQPKRSARGRGGLRGPPIHLLRPKAERRSFTNQSPLSAFPHHPRSGTNVSVAAWAGGFPPANPFSTHTTGGKPTGLESRRTDVIPIVRLQRRVGTKMRPKPSLFSHLLHHSMWELPSRISI
jgi:hypothetical protein